MEHMLHAASRIPDPDARLYKAIATFHKRAKKPQYRAVWGRVYSFMYAAKFAKTLPYYDRYPMVLIIRRNVKKKIFDGYNLHYISPQFRTILLRGIMHLYMAGADRYLMAEFETSVAKMVKRIAGPCLHRYRMDHVINLRYISIPSLIPIHLGSVKDQTFIRAGLQKVWMDSQRAIFRRSSWKLRAIAKKKAAKLAKAHAAAKKKAEQSSIRPKPRRDRPTTKSATARNSKARTGKKYVDKTKKVRRKRKRK